jgi:hypothetical protein
VYLKDYLLKDAANILGINYSTAKTILRIFRLEKRIDKKKAGMEMEGRYYFKLSVKVFLDLKNLQNCRKQTSTPTSTLTMLMK